MNPEQIASKLTARPFVPFKITLSEGTQHEIMHPELCVIENRALHIGIKNEDHAGIIVDKLIPVSLIHVVKIEPLEPSGTQK